MRVDYSEDDAAIFNIGWTAASEIEQFAQIALIDQLIRVTIFDPSLTINSIDLPIGPVRADTVVTVLIDGLPFTDFELVPGHRAYLRRLPFFIDREPIPARMSIEYVAGFGSTAEDIPHDLTQALMDQAALHYDARSPMDGKIPTTSPHMARVGARYRGVKL